MAEKEYIEREAAIDAMWEGMPGLTFNEALKRLRELPTAEKKGKWVEFANEDGELDLKCSVCGEEQGFYFGYFNYCPNCGARMEG